MSTENPIVTEGSKGNEAPKPSRIMLDRWRENIADRQVIEEFWEWLIEQYSDVPNPEKVCLYDIHISKKLDEFHEIDQRQLDDERRALLASHLS